MYPKFFQPNEFEIFTVDDKIVEIPKCNVLFEKWEGIPLKETFGGKPTLSVNDNPMFAELAIWEGFIRDGWEARWIETYGKNKKSPIYLSQWKDEKYKFQKNDPINNENILKMLDEIAIINNDSFSGCWDVLAWKDDNFIFSEAKRTKRDKIRSTQINWLSAGLKYGLQNSNFLVVQWDFELIISNNNK